MHYSLLLLLLIFLEDISANNSNYSLYNAPKKLINIIRNNTLRLVLSRKFNRAKQKIHIVNKVINRNLHDYYNKILSKYYGCSYEYYNLSENDKTILDNFISSCY
jgi:hypothetical protein